MTHEEMLADYARPGVFTGLGGFEVQIDSLPDGVAAVAGFVQNLLMHEGLASAYGVALSSQRIDEKQLHGAAAMLDRAARLDDRPLSHPRAPEHRVVGVCRHFATLFVACMRRRGVPARVRCGFANYFAPGRHLDHWVGEYWNAGEGRWVLVDAQIDDRQRAMFALTLDTFDVPRDRFLVAGDAWRSCRNGADPMRFGVAGTTNWGLIEVYGNIFQDLAALQNIELLPWGWYGLALDESGVEDIALIDGLAEISSVADAAALDALRERLALDERLRVPAERVTTIATAERAGLRQA
jgi:hypothetical protein